MLDGGSTSLHSSSSSQDHTNIHHCFRRTMTIVFAVTNAFRSYHSITSLSQQFSSHVRLTKRMSELSICSRREADRWIQNGLVSVYGKVAEIGEKVDARLPAQDIVIESSSDHDETLFLSVDGSVSTDLTLAMVLNKPPGYVSGQAEHGHRPAIRLLTRDRLWNSSSDDVKLPQKSWKHFAPAGRLDLDSSGLVVFARSGVIAKKLIHSDSAIEKEYIVGVEPAAQESKREVELDENFVLPRPGLDLTPITRGGGTLLGEFRPLKPCKAKWLEQGSLLQIVLTEGRKQHIRRACRQLLGYHVVSLNRTRIGPIETQDLPEGCWRPLSKNEIEKILAS
jgi:23S rRNA pseudouridine2604 synthase